VNILHSSYLQAPRSIIGHATHITTRLVNLYDAGYATNYTSSAFLELPDVLQQQILQPLRNNKLLATNEVNA